MARVDEVVGQRLVHVLGEGRRGRERGGEEGEVEEEGRGRLRRRGGEGRRDGEMALLFFMLFYVSSCSIRCLPTIHNMNFRRTCTSNNQTLALQWLLIPGEHCCARR